MNVSCLSYLDFARGPSPAVGGHWDSVFLFFFFFFDSNPRIAGALQAVTFGRREASGCRPSLLMVPMLLSGISYRRRGHRQPEKSKSQCPGVQTPSMYVAYARSTRTGGKLPGTSRGTRTCSA